MLARRTPVVYSGSMDQTAEPPCRRLRFTLTADGHDLPELIRNLEQIALDLSIADREERDVTSSAGYHYKLQVRDPDMTPERYEGEMCAWWHAQRAARGGTR